VLVELDRAARELGQPRRDGGREHIRPHRVDHHEQHVEAAARGARTARGASGYRSSPAGVPPRAGDGASVPRPRLIHEAQLHLQLGGLQRVVERQVPGERGYRHVVARSGPRVDEVAGHEAGPQAQR
jgi:hypothetical protein